MNQKNALIIGIVLYLLAAGGSYFYFSGGSKGNYTPPTTTATGTGTGVDSAPKTEACPLNGQLYSKAQKAKWEKRRPLGVAIENSVDARPQSGLSSADIVYEVVAEGGITRFLGIFYCNDAKIAGPVRSARIYFIRLLQGYGNNPLYAHVGGANTPGPADALGEIRDLGWGNYNDLSQFAISFPYYWRDEDRLPGVATEHTMYTDTEKLFQFAKDDRKLSNVDEDGVAWDETFTPWKFQDDAKTKGKTAKITYHFWDQSEDNFGVTWNYDPESNMYKRVNGGNPHLDKNTEKQLAAKNVIVMLVDESPANDGYEGGHLLYDLTGTGTAYIFQNGNAIKGEWSKGDFEEGIVFTDDAGDEVEMVRGQVFVSVIPTGNKVTY